jgi:hypothetical protein
MLGILDGTSASTTDPRSGLNKIEVVELNQGEPDPALFAAPAGYSREEQSVKAISSAGCSNGGG